MALNGSSWLKGGFSRSCDIVPIGSGPVRVPKLISVSSAKLKDRTDLSLPGKRHGSWNLSGFSLYRISRSHKKAYYFCGLLDKVLVTGGIPLHTSDQHWFDRNHQSGLLHSVECWGNSSVSDGARNPSFRSGTVLTECQWTISGYAYSYWNVGPRSLASFEVAAQVLPLKEGHNSVTYASQNTYDFETSHPGDLLPPWHIFLLAILGVVGIAWGWENDRRLPWSFIGFLLGIVFWGYALYFILPWLASF
jgi:hypothetical protein